MADELACRICNQTKRWHDVHQPRHAFVGPDDTGLLREPEAPPTPSVSMRGDPVLRLALVKSGMINELQIAEAETWVRTAAEQGMAVVIEDGAFKLLTIEEWIQHSVGVG